MENSTQMKCTHCAGTLAMSLTLTLFASPCSAQSAADSGGAFRFFLTAGSSQAQRLPDGFGFHGGAAVERALGRRVGVRLEGTYHAYGEVPVYPCLFQDAERCYSTVDRQVTAGIANLTYDIPLAGQIFYLIGGVGVYGSRRVASQYPACAPNDLCFSTVYRMSIRATGTGVSGGVGTRMMLGTVPLFFDLRIHYASRTTPEGQPSNDYFLMPMTVGLRF